MANSMVENLVEACPDCLHFEPRVEERRFEVWSSGPDREEVSRVTVSCAHAEVCRLRPRG